MESQTQASHPSHRPWKSRKTGAIPTFPPLRQRLFLFRTGPKSLPYTIRPGVGQIKPPKWASVVAKRICHVEPMHHQEGNSPGASIREFGSFSTGSPIPWWGEVAEAFIASYLREGVKT